MSAKRAWTPAAVRALGVRTDAVTAGTIFGLGRSATYQAVRTNSFPVPVIKVGSRYVVPVLAILRLLGIDEEPPA